MRLGLLLFTLATLSFFQRSQAQACLPGNAELTIAASTLASTFPVPPSSVTLTYTVTNNSTLTSAQGVVVRLASPSPAYTFALTSGFAGNSNWTVSSSGNYTLVTYTGNGGVLGCSPTTAQFQVTVSRIPPAAITIFPLTASVLHAATDPYPYNNNWAVRFTAQ